MLPEMRLVSNMISSGSIWTEEIHRLLHDVTSDVAKQRISGDLLLLRSIPLNNGSLTWKSHTTMNGCVEL